ncbi:hypothetical protein PIROE2DRAFT_1485 [Piromyces sp. E2]|nr:hypothetical protein PIROE2DRAFT_1485 [Piromyces sp. E2]|eukprot:OUM70350.1 hypothetical protein PIROE2DRAFT_1485 [Piromyces sp. E2]
MKLAIKSLLLLSTPFLFNAVAANTVPTADNVKQNEVKNPQQDLELWDFNMNCGRDFKRLVIKSTNDEKHSYNNEDVHNFVCSTSGCRTFVEDGDNKDVCCKNICGKNKWGNLNNKSFEFIVDGGRDHTAHNKGLKITYTLHLLKFDGNQSRDHVEKIWALSKLSNISSIY